MSALSRIGRWFGGVGRGAFALAFAPGAMVPALAESSIPAGPHRPDLRKLATVGTRITGGRIWGKEINTALEGTRWPPIAEEMVRTDSVLMAASRALIGTQLTATWKFTVRDDAPPLAVEAAAQLNNNFGLDGGRGRLTGGWEGVLGQALQYQSLGYRYMEPVYFIEGGRVWVDILDCEPAAHMRWGVDRNGELAHIVQQTPAGDYGGWCNPTVPAEKVLLFTHARTGANFEGVGLLRPCWFPWTLKKHAYDQIAIGVERWAVPTPVVTYDMRALRDAGFTPPQIATMIANANESLKAYVGHESAYLGAPTGITFSAFGDNVGQHLMPGEVVKECNREMLMAFGLQFLMLGVSDTGSRAVGDVQASFFRRQAVNGLDLVAAVVGGAPGPGRGLVGRLMRWNFPTLPPEEWPRLEHRGLDPGPLLELLTALPALGQSGFVTPTDAMENAILDGFRQPPLAKAFGRDPTERAAMGSPLGAAASLMTDLARERRKSL